MYYNLYVIRKGYFWCYNNCTMFSLCKWHSIALKLFTGRLPDFGFNPVGVQEMRFGTYWSVCSPLPCTHLVQLSSSDYEDDCGRERQQINTDGPGRIYTAIKRGATKRSNGPVIYLSCFMINLTGATYYFRLVLVRTRGRSSPERKSVVAETISS